jgi:hypothetical protein
MMRLLEWVGYKVGDGIYYVLHELLGIDPPDWDTR